MLCHSPASLSEGGGGQGAGGGLGIQPLYDLHKPKATNPLSCAFPPICGLMPNVPSRPLTPSPPFRRGGGVRITAAITGDAGVSPADSLEQTAWVCHANTIKAYALPAPTYRGVPSATHCLLRIRMRAYVSFFFIVNLCPKLGLSSIYLSNPIISNCSGLYLSKNVIGTPITPS